MQLPFVFSGIIVKGNQLGRTIGFPTANLLPETGYVLPLNNGVYAVMVKVLNHIHPGMANVGVKPTLGLHELTVEIHIFDFNDEIYGEMMEVTFLDFIREEKKFSGLDALKEQIGRDEARIRNILRERM